MGSGAQCPQARHCYRLLLLLLSLPLLVLLLYGRVVLVFGLSWWKTGDGRRVMRVGVVVGGG